MASAALTKTDSSLVAVFKVVNTTRLDYSAISSDLGCKKELMSNRMYVLKKKINSTVPNLSTNDIALLAAVFKVVKSTGLDYAKMAAELGCKKELMSNRMYVLKKKLGVGPARGGGKSSGPTTTRAGNKAAVRAGKGETEGSVASKRRGRPKTALPDPEVAEADAESEVEESKSDDEMKISEQDAQDGQEDYQQDSKAYDQEADHEYPQEIQEEYQQDYREDSQEPATENAHENQQQFHQQYVQYNQNYTTGYEQEDDEEEYYYDAICDEA